MARKRIDKEQRKREIALSALEIFAEKGFESASISRIAKAAGMGKGTVYEYFRSKEELMAAAIVYWIDTLILDVQKTLSGIADPEQRLRTFVRDTMKVWISDERSVKLTVAMFQMMLTKPEFSERSLVRDMFQGMRRYITEMLLEGASKGIFRPDISRDAEKTAINLIAYLDGIGLHFLMAKNYFNLKEQVDFFLDHMIAGIKPGTGG